MLLNAAEVWFGGRTSLKMKDIQSSDVYLTHVNLLTLGVPFVEAIPGVPSLGHPV